MGILEDIGAIGKNPYGVPSTGQWNLARGIYKNSKTPDGLVFFYEQKKDEPLNSRTGVDQITDTGGRRLAKYEYPYKDGQKLKDLGRKGEKYVINIKFFGLDYQSRFNQFINVVVDSNEMGKITHPIRGTLSVRFSEYEFVHRHDEWNAVTIRATFEEDNTDSLNSLNSVPASQDSSLRTSLQTVINVQNKISSLITETSAALLTPAAIVNGLKSRLDSVVGGVSRLLGQLTATYSTSSQAQQIAAQAASTNSGSVTALNSGTQATGSSVQSTLPPVFQVGFDAKTQESINTQTANFVSANKITTQQAVYSANASRTEMKTAIAEVTTAFGNYGYDINLQYRALAIALQEVVEAAVSLQNSKVKLYTVPNPMSLRMVAKNNNLSYNRQNDIEALNPYLSSVNFIPAGTVLTVPAA